MESGAMKSQKGFTLIEVMVAVVIVAILATIAIPSYREYVIRSHRRAAQAAMMEIATQQQQYFVANRWYATAAQLGYVLPPEVDEYYDLTINAPAPAVPPAAPALPTFTITLTATGSQAGDGPLSINSEGVKTPAAKW
jgi:type IV pilus assembly protein PilE